MKENEKMEYQKPELTVFPGYARLVYGEDAASTGDTGEDPNAGNI